jgi:hypothetical protein
MTRQFRDGPFIPFDTITGTARVEGEATKLSFVARGQDEQAIQESVAELEEIVKEGREELGRNVQRTPFAKPMADFFNSIRLQRDGATVTMTGTFQGKTSALLMRAFMWMVMGIARPAPAPARLEPVPE